MAAPGAADPDYGAADQMLRFVFRKLSQGRQLRHFDDERADDGLSLRPGVFLVAGIDFVVEASGERVHERALAGALGRAFDDEHQMEIVTRLIDTGNRRQHDQPKDFAAIGAVGHAEIAEAEGIDARGAVPGFFLEHGFYRVKLGSTCGGADRWLHVGSFEARSPAKARLGTATKPRANVVDMIVPNILRRARTDPDRVDIL